MAILLTLMLLLPVLSVPAMAEDSFDVSFYEMAYAASAYLSNELATSDDEQVSIPNLNSCSAGGLLGYSDGIDESGFVSKWIMSALSTSSATLSYDSLYNVNDDTYGGFYGYVMYGQMLKHIGFDNTATESTSFFRKAAGVVVLLTYYCARIMPGTFNQIVEILQGLNPFRWIDTGHDITWVDSNGVRQSLDMEAPGGIGDGAFAPIAAVFGRLYRAIYNNIAIWVFVFMFAVLATNLLFDNLGKGKGQNWQRIKKFLIRGFAMFVGVPLCASLYSQSLSMLHDMTDENNMAASRIIASTFIDFEGWAREFQLGIPSRSGSVGDARFEYSNRRINAVSASTYVNLQASCYNINRAVWAKSGRVTDSYDALSMVGNAFEDMDDKAASLAIAASEERARLSHQEETVTRAQSGVIEDLIERYANGDFYYPGSWETDVRASMRLGGENSNEKLKTMLKKASKPRTFEEGVIAPGYLGRDGRDMLWGASGWLSATSEDSASNSMTFINAQPMSKMALYNYLSSDFGSRSMVIYSNENASSGFVRKSHFSVNLIGGGLLGILFYLDMVVLLFIMGFIGFFYSMAILFANLRRTFSVMVSVFGTVSGSIKMFAKLLTFIVVSILEIIGTMFAYMLATDLLLALNQIVTTPLLAAMSKIGSGSIIQDHLTGRLLGNFGGLAAKPILVISLIIDIIVMILFTIMAMKVRKDIVKAIEEIASAFIDKVLGVQHQPLGGGSPGLGGRMAGGLMAGLGAGAAANMLSGRGDSESDGTTKGTSSADENDGAGAPDGKDGKNSKDGKDGGKEGDGKKTKAGDEAGETGKSGNGSSAGGGGGSTGPGLGSGERDDDESPSADELSEVQNAESLDEVNAPVENDGSADGLNGSNDGVPDGPVPDADDGQLDKADADDDDATDKEKAEKPIEANNAEQPQDGAPRNVKAPGDKSNKAADKDKSGENQQSAKKSDDKKPGDEKTDSKLADESKQELKPLAEGDKAKADDKTKKTHPAEKSNPGKPGDKQLTDAVGGKSADTDTGTQASDNVEEPLDAAKPVAGEANSGVKSLRVDPSKPGGLQSDSPTESSSGSTETTEQTTDVNQVDETATSDTATPVAPAETGVSGQNGGVNGQSGQTGVNGSSKLASEQPKPAEANTGKDKKPGGQTRRGGNTGGKQGRTGKSVSRSPGGSGHIETETEIKSDLEPAAPAALNIEPNESGAVVTSTVDAPGGPATESPAPAPAAPAGPTTDSPAPAPAPAAPAGPASDGQNGQSGQSGQRQQSGETKTESRPTAPAAPPSQKQTSINPTRIAAVTAAGAFMASSNNQTVSQLGGAITQGTTMSITQEALNRDRRPAPAPSTPASAPKTTEVKTETITTETTETVTSSETPNPAPNVINTTKTTRIEKVETVSPVVEEPVETPESGVEVIIKKRRRNTNASKGGKKRKKVKVLDNKRSKAKNLDDFLT